MVRKTSLWASSAFHTIRVVPSNFGVYPHTLTWQQNPTLAKRGSCNLILLSPKAVQRLTGSSVKAYEARVRRGSLQPMTSGYDKHNDRMVRGHRLDAVAGCYNWTPEGIPELLAAYGLPAEAGGDPIIHGVYLIDEPVG